MNKRYLLFVPVFLVTILYSSHLSAQEKTVSSTSLTEDSIKKLRFIIAFSSLYELNKMRESYIYKYRIDPTEQNKELLLYIEENIRIKKENQ